MNVEVMVLGALILVAMVAIGGLMMRQSRQLQATLAAERADQLAAADVQKVDQDAQRAAQEAHRTAQEALTRHMTETVARLNESQAAQTARLQTMSDGQTTAQTAFNERLQAQERALTKALDERLGAVSKRLGDGLSEQTAKTHGTLTQLAERLAVIDAAQKNITELSAQVVGLQDILSNKQSRGAFGEIQLNDLVKMALPPNAYDFQVTLGNGKRADCVLRLPNPPGSIVVDAKFPLDSYRALCDAEDKASKQLASRTFGTDVLKHVRDIAEKYILPGETAESALMFIPSEAVYAELHANNGDIIDKSHRARVWIVSPTTLMAVLTTVRAVLKDANMREQAGVIQDEVLTLLKDMERLDERVGKLRTHFTQAEKDIGLIETSTGKITSRGDKIQSIQLGDNSPVEELEPQNPTRLPTAEPATQP